MTDSYFENKAVYNGNVAHATCCNFVVYRLMTEHLLLTLRHLWTGLPSAGVSKKNLLWNNGMIWHCQTIRTMPLDENLSVELEILESA